MIVTCEECKTSFRLDEARLPATGAQVRCSRCKHAFFLANPTASRSEAVHAVASEAAQSALSPTPAATTDLATEAATPGANADTGEPEAEEEEWQFSEEIRIEGDDGDDGLGAGLEDEIGGDFDQDSSVESDFGENPDFSQGFEEGASNETSASGLEIDGVALADQSEGSGLELETEPEPVAPVRDESSFGSVDDFSSLMEDDDEQQDEAIQADMSEEPPPAAKAPVEIAGTYATAGPTDDLGDPESWDLVGGDEGDGAYARPPAHSSVAAALGQEVSAADFFAENELESDGLGDGGWIGSLVTGVPAQVGRCIGWVAATALVGWVCITLLTAEWNRWVQAPQQVRVGSLTVEATASQWVETSRSGPVLRFVGELRNDGREMIRPGTVQMVLLDGAGTRLPVQPIVAGSLVDESVLREAPPEVLLANAHSASQFLAQNPLSPGEAVGFEALLLGTQLPKAARRVLLEVGGPSSVLTEPNTVPVNLGTERANEAEGVDLRSEGSEAAPVAAQLEAESEPFP